jgi:Uri superfamily endonuclease
LLTAGRLHWVVAADTDERLECPLADILAGKGLEAVAGFGSSDCRCRSHLFRSPCEGAVNLAEAALVELGLRPRVLPS